jgi:hypothetical protein
MGACASTSSVRVTPTAAVAIRSDAAGTTARPAEAARGAQQGGCAAAADACGEGGNGSDEAIRLGNVQRAQIEHLQSLQARQTTPISSGETAERSVPPRLGAGGETTAEVQLAILQEHFNAVLQVLSCFFN